jgi:hypothetical protein
LNPQPLPPLESTSGRPDDNYSSGSGGPDDTK